MPDLWHPDAIRVPAPADKWGRYDSATPWRGVLHTTETDYYVQSTASYFGHQSWPHSTIGQRKDGVRGIFHHIPINRAARALKNPAGGVQTNNARAVQAEIVWRAGNAAAMPDWLLELVAAWMRWVEDEVGVARSAVTFYGPDAGWTLATPTARQRMSAAEWNAFGGWCGHQHVPENDHWDPGAIPINRLLTVNQEDDLMPALADNEQRDLLTAALETRQIVGNLQAIANRDIDTLRPLIEQVLQAVKDDPGSGTGAGDVDPTDFVVALRDALTKGVTP